jgi:hypothetical protein
MSSLYCQLIASAIQSATEVRILKHPRWSSLAGSIDSSEVFLSRTHGLGACDIPTSLRLRRGEADTESRSKMSTRRENRKRALWSPPQISKENRKIEKRLRKSSSDTGLVSLLDLSSELPCQSLFEIYGRSDDHTKIKSLAPPIDSMGR